ncbi:hypothetical protein [Niallia taxi]|uniref:hypothetical protein n=1 Tax=Niallia taxi TaxID=2499688 RepID=UPI00300AE91C
MSDKESNENFQTVTTKQLAVILGVTDSRIRQLDRAGTITKISRGKYDLPFTIQQYIQHLKEDMSDDELNKNYEEALWTRAKRQKTELELQIMKGELHRSTDVKRVLNNMLASFRARILTLPSKTAPLLIAKTDINNIKAILKDASIEALTELSEYDPHVFYAESKDKLFLDDDEEEDDLLDDKVVKGNFDGKNKKKE